MASERWMRSALRVKVGQVLAQVIVDKVSVEVEAPIDGVITCLVEEEGTAEQGQEIARID